MAGKEARASARVKYLKRESRSALCRQIASNGVADEKRYRIIAKAPARAGKRNRVHPWLMSKFRLPTRWIPSFPPVFHEDHSTPSLAFMQRIRAGFERPGKEGTAEPVSHAYVCGSQLISREIGEP